MIWKWELDPPILATEGWRRFLAAETPYLLTGTPGSSARDAGDRVVEIVTDKLMLDELLDTDLLRLPTTQGIGDPDERGRIKCQIVTNKNS